MRSPLRPPPIPPARSVARCAFALCVTSLSFVAAALDPARSLSQYGHDAWTDRNGLPQNSIQAVVQTRDGYIWMGTQEGLVRFDGLRFQVLDRQNTPAMASSNVLALLQDHEGGLWAGLESGGALRFKDGGVTTVGTAQGLHSDKVLCLFEGRDHRLWLGTDGGGLGVLRDGKVSAYGPKNGLVGSVVNRVMEDRDGTLWVGTNRGLFRMRGDAFQRIDLGGAERNWFYALAEGGDGTIWVGTLKGLFALRKGGAITRYGQAEGLCADDVTCLFTEPASEALWVGTSAGLNRFRGGRFEAFTAGEGLSNGSIESLCGDTEGSLWIGTAGGLNRFRDTKFYAITVREGLSADTVFSVCETQDGSLWVASDGGGVTRLRGNAATHFFRRRACPRGPSTRCAPTAERPFGRAWMWAAWPGSTGSASSLRPRAIPAC